MPTPLEAELIARIRRDGPIPFSDFMEAALYHPEHGYYARGPAIGPEGDFGTAANLPPFAWALARLARQAWERLGKPHPFRVVEVGGGTGALATRLREEVARDAELAKAARFVLVERAAGLAQRQRAAGFDVVASLAQLPPAPTLVLANEVLDAFPVRLFPASGLERRVGERDGRLVFVDVPSAETVLVPDDALAEIPVGVEPFLRDVARTLAPGYAVFVDYGDDPLPPRPDGSVRAFREHRVESDVLTEPGRRDLTADVDFGRVRRAARAAGLDEVGFTSQGKLLAALDILRYFEERQRAGDVHAALQAKTLLLPGGMGERFRVLGLSRGAPPLPAFASPW